MGVAVIFDALDGINVLTDQLANVSASIAKLDELQPKLLAVISPQIAKSTSFRDIGSRLRNLARISL